jgi:radical SAM superfamily enzyme YgiQ (UPF0313 family)
MKLLLLQPAVGHRPQAAAYPRAWLMEPLSLAVMSGLTPPEVERVFYDDRLDQINYAEKADAALLTIETYTARRAYEIAAALRRRGLPVLAGGFHPTLVPDEVQAHVDSLIVGEAENVWPEVLDDIRHKTLKPRYESAEKPDLALVKTDRGLFAGRKYMPVTLVETGRGCGHHCDFCSIRAFYRSPRRARPVGAVLEELKSLGRRPLFFVDDNFAAHPEETKELLRALAPLGLRWVTQFSLNAARDEEILHLMRRAGCLGALLGFESLSPDTLRGMGKSFNTADGDYTEPLQNLRRHGLVVYATFVFGYDHDTLDTFEETLDFALGQGFYLAAFNHLVPFPGTPLYRRLETEGRLRFPAWWLDPEYRFNRVAFHPANMTAGELSARCYDLRRRFYSYGNILKRLNRWNGNNFVAARNYPLLNILHRGEVEKRQDYPLGGRPA